MNMMFHVFFCDKGYVWAPSKGKSSVSSQLLNRSIKTMCYNCDKKKQHTCKLCLISIIYMHTQAAKIKKEDTLK